ncbi:hypothetical protein ABPG74_001998 [Tetrahymena malaccensis]
MILKKVLFILLLQLVLIESSNRIPGVDIVGCGFDATSLQSKQCLFDLEGKITEWTNPNDPSISFEVPNNLFIMDNPDSLSINGTTVFSSFNDFVQNSFWKTEEDDSGFLGFGARHETIEYSDYYTNMYSKYEKLALTLRQITWYTLKLRGYPKPKFSRIFQQALDYLPETFNDQSEVVFREFINAFGTHVVVKSDFGGLVYAQDWIEDCLFKMHDDLWIKDEVTIRYDPLGIFKKKSDSQTNITHNSQDFKYNSRHEVLLLGGTEKIPLDQWDQWVQTIKYNPKSINKKLFPLTYFLDDGPKKEALNQALKAYRSQADAEQKVYVSQLQQISPPPQSECYKEISTSFSFVPAYAVSGNGKGDNQDVKIRVTQFTLKDNQTCHAGLMAVDYFIQDECYSKDQDGNIEVLYERSNYKTRSCEYNAWNVENLNTYNTKVYNDNNWVDTGCSVVQQSSVHFDDFTQPPPDNSKFRMVCIGCDADVYNSPNGPIFQCNCPSF